MDLFCSRHLSFDTKVRIDWVLAAELLRGRDHLIQTQIPIGRISKTEREYWKLQVDKFTEIMGRETTMQELMAPLYSGSESELIRPEARDLLREAKAQGIPVGMLTNDLTAFHDASWIAGITIISEFDAMVDGRQDSIFKPDPAAYQLMCERLNVPVEGTVFVDDQPINLRGAEALGMVAVHLDPRSPVEGFHQARVALGLIS